MLELIYRDIKLLVYKEDIYRDIKLLVYKEDIYRGQEEDK